jgi:hypothetical protein
MNKKVVLALVVFMLFVTLIVNDTLYRDKKFVRAFSMNATGNTNIIHPSNTVSGAKNNQKVIKLLKQFAK